MTLSDLYLRYYKFTYLLTVLQTSLFSNFLLLRRLSYLRKAVVLSLIHI